MPDSAYALYLMSPAKTVELVDATLAARWGIAGHVSEVTCCLSTEAGANAEAARQLGFQGGPLAAEQAVIAAALSVDQIRGRCIDLDGVVVFCLGGAVDHGSGTTVIDILRRP